jgi:hypothetical protein
VKKVLAWLAILRDITLLGIGTFGILHQEWTGHVNVALLGVYTAMLGVPGVARVIAVFRTISTEYGNSSPTPPESPAPQQQSLP